MIGLPERHDLTQHNSDPPPPPHHYHHHNSLPLAPSFFKRGEVNFDDVPRRGGIWRIKKGVEVWCRGGSSYKRGEGGWRFSYLIFWRFIIFTFRNYFTLCKIVLCIWRRIIFFCHDNFVKKGHFKLCKNEPENIP